MIELLATLVILGIILAISLRSIGTVIARAVEESCHSNQQLIEDGYKRLMLYENFDMTITAYMDSNQLEQCPGHGIYTYVDDQITCSKHPRVDEGQIEPEEVPWL